MNLQTKIAELSRELIVLEKRHMLHLTFIVRRNKIISVGKNYKHKTHPAAGGLYQRVHSEFDAIRKLRDRSELYKCKVFNVRLNKHFEFLNSRPCGICQGLLLGYSIYNVCFTDLNPMGRLTWRRL